VFIVLIVVVLLYIYGWIIIQNIISGQQISIEI